MIETERLVLRPATVADVDAFVALYADERVSRWIRSYTPEEARERLAEIEGQWAERGYGRAAIEAKETGEFVGLSGMKYWEQFDEVEVGWTLRPEAWGRGYATEAGRAWVAWGFERIPDVGCLTAMIRPDNAASIRVAERLGFAPWREDVLYGHPVTVHALDRPR